MWSPLDKNCIGQEEIRDVKSIEVRKSSSRGIMKMLIGQTKSLFWVNKVVNYAHNKDANWADKVADRDG